MVKSKKTGKKTIKSCKIYGALSVEGNESVIEVAKKLCYFQERRVFVVNKKGELLGIISLVDINDRVVAKGKDLKKTIAKDIMSYPINLVFDIKTPIEKVKKAMILKDNYYCPVVEKRKLVGLINYSCISGKK
jgi:CBS domain-containing protein